MMKALKSIFMLLAFGLFSIASANSVIIFGFDQSASAQERVVKTRPKQNFAPQMSPPIFAIYDKLTLALEAENYSEASALLDIWQGTKGQTNYEMGMSYQMRGFIAYQQEDIKKAIQEYLKILQLPEIPYGTTDAIRYGVAQFLSVEERFKESLDQLEEWFMYQPNPNSTQYFFKSQVHYQYGLELDKIPNSKSQADKQFQQGIVEIERTINLAKADPLVDILENWYQIQSALYYQLENYAKVRDILEIMIVRWPRPQYWVQLAAMYSEEEQFEKQLAVLDVAYRLGFLEKEQNIVTIAQLYSINGLPYLAAKVMEENMKKMAVVDGKNVPLVNPKEEKNLTLLGQSHLVARDYAKSAGPLAAAAELAEDGKIYLQLGSVYSTLEDWKNAASALQRAIEKAKISNARIDQENRANRNNEDYKPKIKEDISQAYMYLGLAYINFREFTKAADAFKLARQIADPSNKKIGSQVRGWQNYITAEKQRLLRLAASGITPQG